MFSIKRYKWVLLLLIGMGIWIRFLTIDQATLVGGAFCLGWLLADAITRYLGNTACLSGGMKALTVDPQNSPIELTIAGSISLLVGIGAIFTSPAALQTDWFGSRSVRISLENRLDRDLEPERTQQQIDNSPEAKFTALTFLGRIPQGLLYMDYDLYFDIQGNVLSDRDLVHSRMRPRTLDPMAVKQPRPLNSGKLVLWSNNVVTTRYPSSLPKHDIKKITGQLIYPDALALDKAYPGLVKDAIAVSASPRAKFGLILRKDARVYALAQYPEDATSGSTDLPRVIPGAENVVGIATGVSHALLLKSDASVWQWQPNAQAKPDKTNAFDIAAKKIVPLRPVVKVAAVDETSFALGRDGRVSAWGRVLSEHGNSTTIDVPYTVEGLNDITDIVVNKHDLLAVKRDGSLWLWSHSRESIDFTSPPQRITIDGITQMWAGNESFAILKQDGTLWSVGHAVHLQSRLAFAYADALKAKSGLHKTRLLKFELAEITGGSRENWEFGLYQLNSVIGQVANKARWRPQYAGTAHFGEGVYKLFSGGESARPFLNAYAEVPSNSLLGTYLVVGGTLDQWRHSNPKNVATLLPRAYFSSTMANFNEADLVVSYAQSDGIKIDLRSTDTAANDQGFSLTMKAIGLRGLTYQELPTDIAPAE